MRKIALFCVPFSLCASFSIENPPSLIAEEATESEFTVRMLSLGGEGDCSLISYGSTDILIDAGGAKASATRIRKNLDKYVKDKVLEYVVFSHADSDHIINANGALTEWMDAGGSIGMLVDFDFSQDPTCKHAQKETFFGNSPEYASYVKDFRTAYRNNGKIKRYAPVGLLNWKARKIDESTIKNAVLNTGLSFSDLGDEYALSLNPSSDNPYVLANRDSEATIKFLYNHYYDHAVSGKKAGDVVESADKNVISVCTMLKLKKEGGGYKRILYNGDLEEYAGKSLNTITDGSGSTGGETMLLKLNEEEFNEPIVFYKASHHGSNTSNSPYFLERIRPNYIGINAVAGGKYDFPTQKPEEKADSSTMIELTKYTDRIYITDMAEVSEDGKSAAVVPYYGNIIFSMGKDSESVQFQDPDTMVQLSRKKTLFADELWYRQNRPYEADVINLTCPGMTIVNLSYIKLGHVDILLGAGANPDFAPTAAEIGYLKDKVSQLCNDGILEYLIVPGLSYYSYGMLKQILDSEGISKIEKAIYFKSPIQDNDIGKKVKEVKKILSSSPKIDSKSIIPFAEDLSYFLFPDSEDYSLSFFGNVNSTDPSPSFYTLFTAENYHYLHCGDDYKYSMINDAKLKEAAKGKVNTFQMARCGEFVDLNPNNDGSIGSFESFYDAFVNVSLDHNVLINNALHMVDGHLNINVYPQFKMGLIKGELYPTKALKSGQMVHKKDQKSNTINGDIVSRAMITGGAIDIRNSVSRSLIGFSLCATECAKRSDIHKGSYAVPLDSETIELLK